MNAMRWDFELVLASVLIGGVVLLIGFLGYSGYVQSKTPTFTLYKNQWACTNLQTIPITTYMQSGNVMVPITTYSQECHQWSRQP